MLFNLVLDVLTMMLAKAANACLIRGLCSSLFPRGVICLKYADDTILFSNKDLELATNLKWVLTCFEQVSGMIINYDKSEHIPLCLKEDEILIYVNILGCDVWQVPH
jgi:hypothetical protein